MDTNTKLIWTNRALNLVAFCGVLVSALMAAASEIAGIADELTKAGVVPAKWAGIAAIVAVLGHIAAKYSKTPSQAIAAAVPPAKGSPAPPPGTGVILLLAAGALLASSCASLQTGKTIATVKDCANDVTHAVATNIASDVGGVLVCEAASPDALPACAMAGLAKLAGQAGWAAVDCAIYKVETDAATPPPGAKAALDENAVLRVRRAVAASEWRAVTSGRGP